MPGHLNNAWRYIKTFSFFFRGFFVVVLFVVFIVNLVLRTLCFLTKLWNQTARIRRQGNQGCIHWGGWRGGGMPPHFNFQTKKGPTVSVSNIGDIAFYRSSEIMQTKNLTILPSVLQYLDNLRRLFIFSNYIGEIDHFTLDLLN